MESKVCVVPLLLLLYLASAHGATIPSQFNQVLKQVQDFLVNPDNLATAVGMRVKRDTGDWDKEINMEVLGLSFKLKYIDPSNPLKGGHVHLKFPVHRFIKAASFDDVELEFEFKGGEVFDGVFFMKIDYKFVQKFRFFADRPQQGTIEIQMKKEGVKWKTKLSLEKNTKKLFEIKMESDFKTTFHGTVTVDHDNTWEVTIETIPGRRIGICFLQNSVEYSAVFTLDMAAWKADIKLASPGHRHSLEGQINPDAKWGFRMAGDFHGPLGFEMLMNKDYKSGNLWFYNKEKTYALVELIGDAGIHPYVLSTWIPLKLKYVAKYRFLDGWPQYKVEGIANLVFDGHSTKKVLSVDYTEGNVASFPPPYVQTSSNGRNGKLNLEIETTNTGLNYFLVMTHGGHEVFKQEGVRTVVVNDAVKWEETYVAKRYIAQTSPFYKLYCNWIYPVPCTTSQQITRKYTLDNTNSTRFKYEEETVHGVEKVSSMMIDTTGSPYSFTWEVLKAPAFYPFEGKATLEIEPTYNGFKSMFLFEKDGKAIFSQNWDQIIVKSHGKFEWKHSATYSLDEDFYKLNKWYGRLMHPINPWKSGKSSLIFIFQKRFPFIETLDFTTILDSSTYNLKLATNNDIINGGLRLHHNVPVAPHWWPLEGQFSAMVQPKFGMAVGGWDPSYSVMIIGALTKYQYKYEGKTYFKGVHDFTIKDQRSGAEGRSLEVIEKSNITADEHSWIYAKHCKEGYPMQCFKVIEHKRRFYVDSKTYTISFDLKEKLDGEVYQQIKLDTKKSPYTFVWSQPKIPKGILQKMFGLPRVEVTVNYEAGKSKKELVIKSNLNDMDLTIRRLERDQTLHIRFKRNGETYMKLDYSGRPSQSFILTGGHFYIPSDSIFCSHQSDNEGCYTKWEGAFMLKTHIFNAFIKKDTEILFHTEAQRSLSFDKYTIKIKAPHLIPMLFDDPHGQSLNVTIDHQEGKMLHVQTNHPEFSSLKIIDQQKLELNGKELIEYELLDNQFTLIYQLPDGNQIHAQLASSGWDNSAYPKNQGSFKIETPTTNFNLDIGYDVTDVKNGRMMMNCYGENLYFGKYNILRNADWKVNSDKIILTWKGKVEFEEGPLAILSPVDTKGNIDYDVTTMAINANIEKTIAGQKWHFDVSDNKIILSNQ